MSDLMILRCLRCNEPITIPQFFSSPVERLTPALGDTVHFVLTSGARLLVQQEFSCVAYCPGCAPGVRFCVVCGCTDEAACDEGCAWREQKTGDAEDVCTACSEGEEATREIREAARV